jgi:hypothetical protein
MINTTSTSSAGFNMDDLKKVTEVLTGGPPSYEEEQPDIICDKCNKKVDRIRGDRDPKGRGIAMRVYCHGEVEQMAISMAELQQIKPGMLELGRAFLKNGKAMDLPEQLRLSR